MAVGCPVHLVESRCGQAPAVEGGPFVDRLFGVGLAP
jgi:hypothetical protein